MKTYYKLDLPGNPLNPGTENKILNVSESDKFWYKNPNWNVLKDPVLIKELLKSEVLSQLQKCDLVPIVVVVFFMTKNVPLHKSFIHRDLRYNGKEWVDIPFSINFEINPTTTSTIFWWDSTDKQKYCLDTEETRESRKDLMGFRYHEDYLKSTPKYLNFNLIDSVTVKGESAPVLFKTDVAHSVETNTIEGTRFNVSLRFDTRKISTFDEAVERLQPLIIGF
jgi:hypothetical protein